MTNPLALDRARLVAALKDAIWKQEGGGLIVNLCEPDPNPDAPPSNELLLDGVLDIEELADVILSSYKQSFPTQG